MKGEKIMKKYFGVLPSGETASLYTLSCGALSASVTDYGATLVSLLVPDAQGALADVVLGHDDCNGYRLGTGCIGATVGRNANRTQGASFCLGDAACRLGVNDNGNNLHSGPDFFFHRLWSVASVTDCSIIFTLESPSGDQGFPGNARIFVTYTLENDGLRVRYDAVSDRDTVFNMTNHSYFNLAGHEKTDAAMDQLLTLPGRWFNPDDGENIPTGEKRDVSGTPMDFRAPKALGQDLNADYEPLHLQNGYDHNWEVYSNPCAILRDPVSGRTLAITTDCPGIQVYTGNFLNETGKGGVYYGKNSGVALETQFAPDCLHHPDWPQPIVKAGEKYHSETFYRFTW